MISLNEFIKTKNYEVFIKKNDSIGTLKIQTFLVNQGLPIPNTKILVKKTIDNEEVIFYDGYTNGDGMINEILLNTPSIKTQDIYKLPTYNDYDIIAINNEYKLNNNYNVKIFDGQKTIQNIKINEVLDE
ncbi:MAG: hypothetical protein R3Y21_01160 [Mycoplasmatota bacterium]